MIRTNDGYYYLTAGEACCILKADGALKHVYFGKRVEQEDDLDALGFCTDAPSEFGLTVNGKAAALKVTGCEVLAEKPIQGPTLPGGKTLAVKLACGGMSAVYYITPYPRGAFSRRFSVRNDGDKPLRLSPNATVATVVGNNECLIVDKSGNAVRADKVVERDVDNFLAMSGSGGDEENGDSYGFLCEFRDGKISATPCGGFTSVVCSATDEEIVLEKGEEYFSPEVVTAYSDSGIGGMSRIFHDIIREGMNISTARPPIVLFCPVSEKTKIKDAVQSASELGFDVFAVDAGKASAKALGEVASSCREKGIKCGIRIFTDEIDINGAAFDKESTAHVNGNANLFAIVDMREYTKKIISLAKEFGLDYVLLDGKSAGANALALYGMRRVLSAALPDTVFEWGTVNADMRKAYSLCYPFGVMRNVIVPGEAFKSQFDAAVFGRLGYEFDPVALGADTKRAVRAQVFSYQNDAPIVINGDLYRRADSISSVSKDKATAYVYCFDTGERARQTGLDEHNIYHVRELDRAFSGSALKYCGLPSPGGNYSVVYHLRQVADF